MAYLYSGLYEPIPDVDLYLERIDYHGDRAPTLENLKALVKKHLTHIPYGNLDFFPEQNCPSLAIPDIFEKLVVRHGCGGCFELNLLFFGLLKSLGYDLFTVTVRCLFGAEHPVVPTHCAAIVKLDDAPYYVDVGLGDCSPVVPVALDGCASVAPAAPDACTSVAPAALEGEHGWQPETICPYYYSYKVCRDGRDVLFLGNNGQKQMSMVSFTMEPVDAIDFIPLNYYACLAEESPVRRGEIVMIFTEDGRAQIIKDKLTIMTGDTIEERRLETDEEFDEALKDVFGIRVK